MVSAKRPNKAGLLAGTQPAERSWQWRDLFHRSRYSTHHVLHGIADTLRGLVAANEDTRLLVLDELGLALVERTLHTSVFGLAVEESQKGEG